MENEDYQTTRREAQKESRNTRIGIITRIKNLITSIINGQDVTSSLTHLEKIIMNNSEHLDDYFQEIDFPYAFFLQKIIEDPNNPDANLYLSTVSRLSKASNFQFNHFQNSPQLIDFFLHILTTTTNRYVFSNILLLFQSLCHHFPEICQLIIATDFIHNFSNNSLLYSAQRSPFFLREFIFSPYVNINILLDINYIFSNFFKRTDKCFIITSVLEITKEIVERNVQPFNIDYIQENFIRLLRYNRFSITIKLAELITIIPTFPCCIEILYQLIIQNHYKIIPSIMNLFRVKYEIWHQFVNDEFIEGLLSIMDKSSFYDEIEIFKTLLLYFDFNRFHPKMLQKVLKFVVLRDFSLICLCKLLQMLKCVAMNNEHLKIFFDLVNNDLDEIENLVCDYDECEAAGIEFLEMFNELSEKIN